MPVMSSNQDPLPDRRAQDTEKVDNDALFLPLLNARMIRRTSSVQGQMQSTRGVGSCQKNRERCPSVTPVLGTSFATLSLGLHAGPKIRNRAPCPVQCKPFVSTGGAALIVGPAHPRNRSTRAPPTRVGGKRRHRCCPTASIRTPLA